MNDDSEGKGFMPEDGKPTSNEWIALSASERIAGMLRRIDGRLAIAASKLRDARTMVMGDGR